MNTKVRNRERETFSEMREFQIKVYQKNGEAEFIQCFIKNISESGMAGSLTGSLDLKESDVISGVIEGEDFAIKIRYEGTISWIKKSAETVQFGVNFSKEITLPDVLIARLMAVA
ncbi:MAG: PilZ domain-containing protein [Leptospiraceae bacterium]|nr:PilZ domain-containing protein [Leptospiraceae bacterium]MCZ8239706.1 PilZ domain-containing protein [Leptospiraceae bacterium]MCZ8344811.1 PilZ domain-containing protein [Leptospiraceae bacterium]